MYMSRNLAHVSAETQNGWVTQCTKLQGDQMTPNSFPKRWCYFALPPAGYRVCSACSCQRRVVSLWWVNLRALSTTHFVSLGTLGAQEKPGPNFIHEVPSKKKKKPYSQFTHL